MTRDEAKRVLAKVLSGNCSMTVWDVLQDQELIELTGINPWCVNEGLAQGGDPYDISDVISEALDALCGKDKAGEV